MKRGVQKRAKKVLSAEGLLKITRKVFEKIPNQKDNTRGKPRKISLADCLSSALAMFGLKSKSLLAFDRACKNPAIRHNLETLYLVKQPPSDTYMREELDTVDPASIREAFLQIFEAAQRGKLLENYRFLDGYLMLVDGTALFDSDSIHCENCCEKHHKDGGISYYHQALCAVIAHPNNKQVIPVCPELISKQDGCSKNDCERRAMQRFFASLKKEHPRLKLTIASDALSANTPTINELASYGYHYILNVKPGSHGTLFDWIKGLELREVSIVKEKISYTFRYINNVPLNASKDAPEVNFLECVEQITTKNEIKKKTFTWVTDHKITPENVYTIMCGGRARWKIENETFNTLKNQDYQFDHNFGHGVENLLSVFTLLMMIAFLIDQIQEAACSLFQTAHQKMISRRALWEAIRCYFFTCLIKTWDDLFTAISLSYARELCLDSA